MYIIIINPVAGNGKAKKIHQRLQSNEQYKKMQPVCYYTQYKGHATELAENIRTIHEDTRIDAVIVIGGDGTVHEVVNGLRNEMIPITFIPGGSGNDFRRGALISDDTDELLMAILNNKRPAEYWLGVYELNKRKSKLFVNCIGFGFDAVVTKSANKSILKKLFNWLHIGSISYLLALLRVLLVFRPIPVTIDMDGESLYFERCFMLTVNNHPFFGGGMKINPLAENNSTELSIMVIDAISKWKVLALFGTVFFGAHIQFKEVHTYTAKEITVTSTMPMPYQVDGETGSTQYARLYKKKTPVKVIGSKLKQHKPAEVKEPAN